MLNQCFPIFCHLPFSSIYIFAYKCIINILSNIFFLLCSILGTLYLPWILRCVQLYFLLLLKDSKGRRKEEQRGHSSIRSGFPHAHVCSSWRQLWSRDDWTHASESQERGRGLVGAGKVTLAFPQQTGNLGSACNSSSVPLGNHLPSEPLCPPLKGAG